MGLFDKIKDNLTGGGVKLQISAPHEFGLEDAALPVQLAVSADEPRTIKHFEYRLYKHAKDLDDQDTNDSGALLKPLALLNIQGPFQVSPGAPLVRNDQLVLTVADDLKIKSIDQRKYDIRLEAFAQVEGVLINATARHDLRLRQHSAL